MDAPSRRSLLAGAATGLATLAGCLQTDDGSLGGDERPTGSGGQAGSAATESPSGPEPRELESVDAPGSPGGAVAVRTPGEVALLDFFATWCAPCKPQMSRLLAVREAHPDLHVVSITPETDRAAIASFWREYDGAWPVAIDPELRVTDSFDVNRIPTLLVLAPDGNLVWRHTGLAEAAAIRSAVDEARRE
jgi:thiol-disulfide isomerase/thioredoxin